MNICIFGAASSSIESKYTDAAYQMGILLAKAGHTMVFGGGGEGMMGASARGCYDNGGRIIGILPRYFEDGMHETLFEQSHETVYTVDIAERINRMEDMSDAFVVLAGGIGTYDEFFKVLVSISLGQHQKKLAVLNIDGFFDPLKAMLEDGVRKGFISADRMQMFRMFTEEEMEEMLSYLGEAVS